MSSTLMPGLDSSRSTCFIACLLARPRAAASPCPMAATASEAPCITPRVASHRLSMRLACRSAPSTPPSTWRTSLNENWLVMVALMTGSAAFGSWLRSRFGRWGPAKSGSAKTHDLNAGVAHSILFGIPSGRADSFIPTPSKAQNEGMPEGVQHVHLDYYLDEFAFRFNRRRSKARGLLFHRLACQAAAVGPATYDAIVGNAESGHPPAQLE